MHSNGFSREAMTLQLGVLYESSLIDRVVNEVVGNNVNVAHKKALSSLTLSMLIRKSLAQSTYH